MSQIKLMLLVFCTILINNCTVSLKGVSIAPEVNTFFIDDFQLTAQTAPGDLNQRFSEALRNKVRNESRLILSETDPDIVFGGNIRGFLISPEAIREGNTVALNKLEITVDVEYTNNVDEKEGWKKQTFSFLRTFDSNADFQSIQEELIRDIFNQLTEKIFNEAFSKW